MSNKTKIPLPPVLCHAGDGDCYTADQMIEYGNECRKQALEEAAKACDSVGHHWSGAPALAFFDAAEKIRNLK